MLRSLRLPVCRQPSALRQSEALWPAARRLAHAPLGAAAGARVGAAAAPTAPSPGELSHGARAEELPKNFDHVAVEERLYSWCARRCARASRSPPTRASLQVGVERLLPAAGHWRAVHYIHAAAQRDGRAPYGSRYVCYAAGATPTNALAAERRALTRCSQDVMARWARMNGRRVLWLPGARGGAAVGVWS